jgi:hypothetical protein
LLCHSQFSSPRGRQHLNTPQFRYYVDGVRPLCLQPLSYFSIMILALTVLLSVTDFVSSRSVRTASLNRRRRPLASNFMSADLISTRPCRRSICFQRRTTIHYDRRLSLPDFMTPRPVINRIRPTLQRPIIRLPNRAPMFLVPGCAAVGLQEFVAYLHINGSFSVFARDSGDSMVRKGCFDVQPIWHALARQRRW